MLSDKLKIKLQIQGLKEVIVELNMYVLTKEIREDQKQKIYAKKALYSGAMESLEDYYKLLTGEQTTLEAGIGNGS